MSKEPSTDMKQKALPSSAEANQPVATPASALPERPVHFNPFFNRGFFSFRYSYREMSSSGGKTHVRGQNYRYEDGKLSSEHFEGTADGNVYDQAVRNAEILVTDSLNLFFKSLGSLFPSDPAKKNRD
ncbi:MAG: hypothetical protein ACRERV_01595 [Methylococcales bacterium]